MTRTARHLAHLLGSAALCVGAPALAQVGSTPPAGIPTSGVSNDVPTTASAPTSAERDREPRRRRVTVEPYVEVGQILTAELGGTGDVLTYSTLAAGVDATIATPRAQGAASVRYERRFGWGRANDANILSAALRGNYAVTRNLSIEGGAIATRASLDGGRGSPEFGLVTGTPVSDIYSVYAGPSYVARYGDLTFAAAYRLGYSASRLDAPLPVGAVPLARFSDAVTHNALLSTGMRPGRLPFGWTSTTSWEREDAGQLDQRYDGLSTRLDLVFPVSPTVAVVGGVGAERIEVSYRPPLLNPATGTPQVDADGRYVTDSAAPRRIAFDTSGLIWDAGVLWRPSRRMSLEARVGRRYDDWSYTGSWSFQPNDRTAYRLGVYDRIGTVGRGLTSAVAGLPTDFGVVRNPIDGSFSGCLFGSQDAQCLTPLLGNLTGLAYRNRGAILTASQQRRDWTFGVALGYDNRDYLDESGGLLAALAGEEETWFASLSAARQLDERTGLGSSLFWQYYDGSATNGDAFSAGANVALSRQFWRGLTGQAALGLNMIDARGFNTRYYASALLGLRYSFQ